MEGNDCCCYVRCWEEMPVVLAMVELELMATVAMLATKDGNGTSVATVEEVWQRDRGLRLWWLDCMKMVVRFWRRSYSGDG
ncbi:hypothetical protein B296_00033517 [Ensete ventricosum]|uniref:Uncharacterized protein n=1 Tax=Ensete ventricosum TaxID=4639 RepID=A0A427AAM2_ENSVE|nr:hypothetical protein B296_00033517 [Ensete ventricosum]